MNVVKDIRAPIFTSTIKSITNMHSKEFIIQVQEISIYSMNKDSLLETTDILLIDIDLEQKIQLVQQLLTDLIQNEGTFCESIYNTENVPSISLQAYLRRLHKYTQYSSQCLIMALVYLDRYNIAVPQFSINWHNVHKLMLTCLMMAVKFHDDIYFDNCSFGKGGGVNSSQLMMMEIELYEKLQFCAWIDEEQYQGLLQKLLNVYGDE